MRHQGPNLDSVLDPVVSEDSVSEVSSGRGVTNLEMRPRPNCFLAVVVARGGVEVKEVVGAVSVDNVDEALEVDTSVRAVVVEAWVDAVLAVVTIFAATGAMSTGTSPDVGDSRPAGS